MKGMRRRLNVLVMFCKTFAHIMAEIRLVNSFRPYNGPGKWRRLTKDSFRNTERVGMAGFLWFKFFSAF